MPYLPVSWPSRLGTSITSGRKDGREEELAIGTPS